MMLARKLSQLVIPPEMLNAKRWIPVKVSYNSNKEKWDKKPLVKAWGKSRNWKKYNEIKNAPNIGFVLGDGFFGIDLDDCLDESMCVIDERRELVNDVLELCPSFTEVSRSGKGLHVYGYGHMSKASSNTTPGLEMYPSGKFFLFTGRPFDAGDIRPICDIQAGVKMLYQKYDKKHVGQGQRSNTVSPTMSGATDAYGRAALTGECAELAACPEGARNIKLNKAAFRMGQLNAEGHVSASDARDELFDAATESGLPRTEIEATYKSGFSAGTVKPRTGVSTTSKTEGDYNGDGKAEQRCETEGNASMAIILNAKPIREIRLVKPENQTETESENERFPEPIGEEALIGFVGEIVDLIGPQTEADPNAIIMQFLTGFGSLIGTGPHFKVGADKHPARLFVVLSGETSRGRKGTALSWIYEILNSVDSSWPDRTAQGVSSGEGIVWHVRDEIKKWITIRNEVEPKEIVVDPGVEDKRLLLIEGEFAQALRVAERDGSTLSATIRNAWDLRPNDKLGILTKNSPCKSTGAHVSIIGHITIAELKRYLTSTETANGFGNRILWCAVRRSRQLPDGGYVEQDRLDAIGKRLGERVDKASRFTELTRSDKARDLWHDVYSEVSRDNPGLVGAVTARAEAQVTRLSLVFALLDGSSVIEVEHIKAALEVWRYCDDSAAYIFGNATGDPVADEIFSAICSAPDGLTRSELRDLFSRHASRNRISSALGVLVKARKVFFKKEETGGRPTERWFGYRDKSDESDKRGV